MYKLALLCLLSLSMCFSSPVGTEGQPPAPGQTDVKQPGQTDIKQQNAVPEVNISSNKTAATEINKTPITPPPTPPEVTTNKTQGGSTKTKSPVNPADATTTVKPADPPKDSKKDEQTKKKNETSTSTEQSTNASTADKKVVVTTETLPVLPNGNDTKNNSTKESSTPKAPVTISTDKPTTEPTKTEKPEVVLQARGFDGPSFIGGIILTLGMLAIGFIGFKYYKNQTERNYHTL